MYMRGFLLLDAMQPNARQRVYTLTRRGRSVWRTAYCGALGLTVGALALT